MENKKILEALQMQPLSDEEKSARHILGRLYGPIATSKESTRNGRLYNKQLWETALKDEIFLEKVATKSLFLELGHPADREETDMRQACACIPECPKIVDGDLYAYVDILDTPNGRLLKTFVDYGFVPGISSRGSGDVMGNNEVDPETFFLETWDIVALPAVKKARMSVCESVDTESLKLRKALTESYNAASDEDKETMKEALDNLNIKLDESAISEGSIKLFDSEADCLAASAEEDIPDMIKDLNPTMEALEEAADEEEITDEVEEDKVEEEPMTVGDIQDAIEDTEPETPVEVNIEVEGEEVRIADVDVEKTDDAIEIGVSCEPAEGEAVEDTETEEAVEASEDEQANSDEEPVAAETEVESEEAVDDGNDEVIESLKELIRQKDALAEEVKTLRSEKSVGDAKEKELQEELNKYKTAFARVSELASKATVFEKENKAMKEAYEAKIAKLNESLTQKDTEINELNCKAAKAETLTESIDENARKVKTLTEKFATMQKESEEEVSNLKGQIKAGKDKLNESIKVAKAYKTRYLAVMESYVANKAEMLGIRPADITSRLGESYTVKDVDAVCDKLLETTSTFGRLPFSGVSKNVKFNESVEPKKSTDDDDLNDLLELAGLK